MIYLTAAWLLAAFGVFGLFSAIHQYIEWLQKEDQWWGFPAWMVGMMTVFVPAFVALVMAVIYLASKGVQ